MKLEVLYRYMNCTVEKTTDTDTCHTAYIDYITNYILLDLLQILFGNAKDYMIKRLRIMLLLIRSS